MKFQYTALDKNGKKIKAIMEEDSSAAVIDALRALGQKPLNIVLLKESKQSQSLLSFLNGTKTISQRELVIFSRQLGEILDAGVILSEAIETIASDLDNEYFSFVLNEMLSHIRAGNSFSNVLSRYPAVFSSYYIAIVKAGEMIGGLSATMIELANYMEDAESMKQKFIGAIRYPMFLLGFVFCVVSVIVVFLIPRFKVVFEGLGSEMPLITRIVVGVSEFALQNLPGILIVLVALSIVMWRAFKMYRVRLMFDRWLLQIPVIGKILRKIYLGRFCKTSSMLLRGGVAFIMTLDLSMEVLDNLYLKECISSVRDDVTAGAALSLAMSHQKDMPKLLIKMILVGEKTGTLPETLKRMGQYYDEEVETFLNNINSLLEPIFVILIGVIILIVALALYLPIFQMSSH